MHVKDLIDVRSCFSRLHMIRCHNKKISGIVEIDGC
jgi:hypothetical protein